MKHYFLRAARVGGVSTLLLTALPVAAIAAEQVEISDELARLAEDYGFTVVGLEQTTESFGNADGDALYPRLRRLLENFDHVIVQGPEGEVDRVIVLGEKVPFVPPPPPPPATAQDSSILIKTERRGTQHLVQASLGGKGGSKVERELQIDTGADYLVLPLSLTTELGVDKGTLEEREMQTANGKVRAHIGSLPSLWLGGSLISNVETAFLEDDKLGSNGLLGMSVLGRYKLTIDDEKNSVTLSSKETGGATEEKGRKTGSGESVDEEP